jgi:hypothetical protein
VIELGEKIWFSFSPLQPQVLAFILTTLGALLTYFFRARVKLIYGFANNSFHQLKADAGPVIVSCEKHYLQNVGKKPAEKVEVVFSCAPSEITVFPARSFEKKNGPDGQLVLAIPYITPGELIIIDTIHINSRKAELQAVHCPENVGRCVQFWVQRRFRRGVYLFVAALILLGAFYTLQLLISLTAVLLKVNL